MGLFGKKKHRPDTRDGGRAPAEPAELLRVFQTEHFVCQTCHQALEFGFLDAFSLTPCPYCDTLLFIPAKVKSYYLYRPLGGGGMGSVYQAVSEEYPEEFFAVKILPREHRDSPRLGAELYREAQIADLFADVSGCENGVEYGYTNGEYFFAMEYILGIRLDQVIDVEGPTSPNTALRLAAEVAQTDEVICKKGYLYRDLKPENIIIQPDGTARLIDFGLCVEQDEANSPTEDGCVLGSPHYMPPERLAGLPEGEFSEVYSLGMILFHALTGETYFLEEDAEELAVKHISEERPQTTASRMPLGVPEDLAKLVDAMIRKQPDSRLQSLAEVRETVQRIQRHIPTRTNPYNAA